PVLLLIPAASPPHALITRRRCYPTARCSLQGEIILLSRARNCTIRRAGPGRPPAALPSDAFLTRRRCCPLARCSSQEGIPSAPAPPPRNCTTRPARPGRPPPTSPPPQTAFLTRRRCCPMARCLLQAVMPATAPLSRARNSTIRRAG